MTTRLLLTITILLVLAPIYAVGQLKPASEDEKSLLHKEDIIKLMIEAGKIPAQQQKGKIDQLWASESGSKTPRSDFLYCSAFAYLDHYKAQACLGRAFENGSGIVQDYMDAYVWYTVALDHTIDDAAIKEKVQAVQTHVKQILVSVYPAPSDYELEDAVKQQKEKISQYQAEIRNTRE